MDETPIEHRESAMQWALRYFGLRRGRVTEPRVPSKVEVWAYASMGVGGLTLNAVYHGIFSVEGPALMGGGIGGWMSARKLRERARLAERDHGQEEQ